MIDTKYNLFLLAVVPALLAGGFSIAPKLYDVVSEPRAELTYTTTVGPDFVTDDVHQQIALINFRNTGKKALTEVVVSVHALKGKISAARIQNQGDLKHSLQSLPNAITGAIPRMLPADHFSISIMLSNEGAVPAFSISARTDEILGIPASDRDNDKPLVSEYLGSGLAGISVFIMMLVAARRGISLGSVDGNKQDALYFITAACQLPDIEYAIRSTGNYVTYPRMADLALAYGLRSDGNTRLKAINALQCLLLIKDMAARSKEVVICNLRLLQKKQFSKAEIETIQAKGVSVSEVLPLRKRIEELLALQQ